MRGLWLMLGLLVPVAAMAADGNVTPGLYYCVTDRMAGIQPRDGDAGPADRVSGQMIPRSPTFVVAIERTAPGGEGGQWFARLPDDKADMFGNRLSGRDNPNVYHAPTTIFWLAADGSYALARLFGNRGNSVEEGRCQTFQW